MLPRWQDYTAYDTIIIDTATSIMLSLSPFYPSTPLKRTRQSIEAREQPNKSAQEYKNYKDMLELIALECELTSNYNMCAGGIQVVRQVHFTLKRARPEPDPLSLSIPESIFLFSLKLKK